MAYLTAITNLPTWKGRCSTWACINTDHKNTIYWQMWLLALVKVNSTSVFATLTAENTTMHYFIQKSSHVVQARFGDVWKAFQSYSRETLLQVSCSFLALTVPSPSKKPSETIALFSCFLFFFFFFVQFTLRPFRGARAREKKNGQVGSGLTYDAA